jgi:hypothetical protein
VLPLWCPLTHASIDTGPDRFLSQQAFNVRSELGQVFSAGCGWIALDCSIYDGPRKIRIEVTASSLGYENRRIAVRAIMLAVSGPQRSTTRMRA